MKKHFKACVYDVNHAVPNRTWDHVASYEHQGYGIIELIFINGSSIVLNLKNDCFIEFTEMGV